MSTMICDSSAVVLTDDEIQERLARLNGWSRGAKSIEKTYRFNNFLRAISFVNAVAYVAESVNHHPDLIIHYKEVTVRNWTHVAGGVTQHDFSLAERIDAIAGESKIIAKVNIRG
jgi:4a-hydroxytetrahydrobiopterin dehydratase